MKCIKIRYLNKWINRTLIVINHRANMLNIKRKYRQYLQPKILKYFNRWHSVLSKNKKKEASLICCNRLMFKRFARRCKKITMYRLKLHNGILECSSQLRFRSLLSNTIKCWKMQSMLNKSCINDIRMSSSHFKNYKMSKGFEGILYYADLSKWNKRNSKVRSYGTMRYRLFLWYRRIKEEQYKREINKYYKVKMAKMFFGRIFLRKENHQFIGTANRIADILWMGKVFKRIQLHKLSSLSVVANNNLFTKCFQHYEKRMKCKYWKILCSKNNRSSIWVVAGKRKVLTRRAKALSRSLTLWSCWYRNRIELWNIVTYFKYCRGFHLFKDNLDIQLNNRLTYSRADLRYKTNSSSLFLMRLHSYAKRSISLRRNFKVFRRLHPVPVCSSCRRILRAWRFEYVLNSKRLKLLHKVTRNRRRLSYLQQIIEIWECRWSYNLCIKALARRVFRKLGKMICRSNRKWLKFQNKFLKVHVVSSNDVSNSVSQALTPVDLPKSDFDSLMNLAAIDIEYFLGKYDNINKSTAASKHDIDIAPPRKLLRFLTHKALKYSCKRQLDRICRLRGLFRLWSTISIHLRNVRIELRNTNELNKIHVSTYFAISNLHGKWLLYKSMLMWKNVQQNREEVINKILLRQYCKPSLSHWMKVYNDRLINRNLKKPSQEGSYEVEKNKLHPVIVSSSSEKYIDHLTLLKSSYKKKKIRFNESMNTFDDNENKSINTPSKQVHWNELTKTRGYLHQHEFRLH